MTAAEEVFTAAPYARTLGVEFLDITAASGSSDFSGE